MQKSGTLVPENFFNLFLIIGANHLLRSLCQSLDFKSPKDQ